jgi:hypothetical protein
MTRSDCVIAALAAIAIAAPAIANADTIVIKHRNQHWRGAHAEFGEHRDNGWHRDRRHRDHDTDRDRLVIREHHERYSRDRN